MSSNIYIDYIIGGGGTPITGTTGSSGSSGSSGTSGTSGLSGVTGSNGSSGTSGLSGVTGSNGTSGTSGLSGATGTSGTRGTSGSSGSSGTSGGVGASGSSGTSGINGGVTITYTDQSTYSTLSTDFYILIDTTNNTVTIKLQHFDNPKEIYLKDYGGNANAININISADAPATMESGAPTKIQTNYGAVHFVYDNTNFTWRPISQYP